MKFPIIVRMPTSTSIPKDFHLCFKCIKSKGFVVYKGELRECYTFTLSYPTNGVKSKICGRYKGHLPTGSKYLLGEDPENDAKFVMTAFLGKEVERLN